MEKYLKRFVGEYYAIIETSDMIYIGSDRPDEFSGSNYTKRCFSKSEFLTQNAVGRGKGSFESVFQIPEETEPFSFENPEPDCPAALLSKEGNSFGVYKGKLWYLKQIAPDRSVLCQADVSGEEIEIEPVRNYSGTLYWVPGRRKDWLYYYYLTND